MEKKDLKSRIEEAIKNDLPNQIGTALRKRLQEADEAEASVVIMQHSIDGYKKDISRLSTELEQSLKSLGDKKLLEKKEQELTDKEEKLNVAILEVKLEESEKRADFAASIGLGLVRNTNYRKNVYDSLDTMTNVSDGHGGVITHPSNTTKTFREDKTED